MVVRSEAFFLASTVHLKSIVGKMWSVVDYQEMSLPPSHDSRWDNSAQENQDEISADQADSKNESSLGQSLVSQPAKLLRFGKLLSK